MNESPTTPPRDPNGFGAPVPPVPPIAPPAPPVPVPAEQQAADAVSRPTPPPAAPAPPAPGTPAPAASAPAAPEAAAALDEGTYRELRTPRSSGALALDGTWHQISPRYVVSQFVQNAILIAFVVAAALIVGLVLDQSWVWIPAGAITLITLLTLVILPRQAKALGYMLRADDVVFRKGILWQRIVAVPYGRMQLVDITQGPLDRTFGISQLKMVTAAATTGVQIPGLTQAAAEALRDTLIEVAETRRTGL
ncbi:PH domain-containing protein [Microbacterium sp. NPDC058342]|uniref:PH domain-containing protein n=1 Tax=Microbacterium sp. NPDC058342 TaxID=3346454 RepID=UPI00365B1590